MSSVSAADCTSKESQVMAGAALISRNSASGNAVQINGTVADKVYNVNM
jgi:hypothetical protein